jgi:hypothetical protein
MTGTEIISYPYLLHLELVFSHDHIELNKIIFVSPPNKNLFVLSCFS